MARFNALQIDGHELEELETRIGETFALLLYDSSGGNLGYRHELRFNRVIDGHLEKTGSSGMGTIASHGAYSDSEVLRETLDERGDLTNDYPFFHFEVAFRDGRVTVIAADFAYSLQQVYTLADS